MHKHALTRTFITHTNTHIYTTCMHNCIGGGRAWCCMRTQRLREMAGTVSQEDAQALQRTAAAAAGPIPASAFAPPGSSPLGGPRTPVLLPPEPVKRQYISRYARASLIRSTCKIGGGNVVQTCFQLLAFICQLFCFAAALSTFLCLVTMSGFSYLSWMANGQAGRKCSIQ